MKAGYEGDAFVAKLSSRDVSVPGVELRHGLWYVGGRLYVPKHASLREELFQVAHDSCGHFGAEKSLGNLRDSYYWPGMRRDLERAYVPSCPDCQRNKASTRAKGGPLHPLPVPDRRGEEIAMDFVGPLPVDSGYDCIQDLCIVPLHVQ